MIPLLATIAIMIVAFLTQSRWPFIAGLLAVLPVKIIGVVWAGTRLSPQSLQRTIEGLLLGQFFWGFALFGLWFWLKHRATSG